MTQTKKCKYCQSDIDRKASICPNCRKKQGGPVKWIVIAVIAIMIIGAALSQDDPKVVDTAGDTNTSTAANSSSDSSKEISDNTTSAEPTATPTPEKTSFSIGETVELNDILVTLVGVSESNGSDFNKPTGGKVFALCEFNIENNSDKDISVSSIMSFEAYCDDYSIQQSITGLIEKGDKGQLDGSVAAGKKMNGVIAYEIPTDWKELEINFTPDFWTSKDIKFIATK